MRARPLTADDQLSFFHLLEEPAAPVVAATKKARPPAAEHPPGSYLIRSESERGYWSNELGWVYDIASATPFTPQQACPAEVVQWRRCGRPIRGDRDHWMWVARLGGLSGYRGADYDGPFTTKADAIAAAIETLGPDRPLMVIKDAEYVLASSSADFALDG